MKKKLLSLMMAVAMVLSLAVPALADNYYDFAAVSDNTSQQVKFEARTFVPTIKLSIPNITADPMILNPYKIEYTGGTPAATLNAKAVHSADQTSQIICPIYAIKNETNAKLNVKVAGTTTVGGTDFTLVNTHVNLTETAKKAFIQLVVQKVSTDSAPGSADGVHIDNGQAMTKLDAYDTANNTVIPLQATNAATQVAQLANGGTTANYLLFQFDGELSRTPTTAWKEADKITTTLTFTFTPVSAPDSLANLNNSAVFGATALGNGTLGTDANKTVTLPTVRNGAITPNGFAANSFVKNPSDANYTLSLNATDIGWEIVDKGPFAGMTKSGDASSGYTLTIPGADLNNLPKDGTPHDYKFTLGYKDKNGVPRTVEVTAQITRAS